MGGHRITLAGVLLLAIFGFATAALAQTMPTTAPATGGAAAIIDVHGPIDDYTRDSLFRKFAQAKSAGAKTIILDLDTPGGLVTAGLDISLFLRGQTDVHTIAFIHPKAYSAGAMISVACDEIVMAPAAVVGDCAPIVFDTGGRLDPLPAAERAKAQSPIVNDFDASAERNHYDPLLLESMVIVERVVYWVQSPTGERRFVDQAGYDKLTATGWKPVEGVPSPVDGPDTLLTVQTDEAVKLGLARGVASSATELAQQRGLTIVADLTSGSGERFVELLANDSVRGLLLTIFLTSLYISLASPGHGAAEATAVCSLGFLIGVPLLTGYAQWWEMAAIFLGLGLLAFEIFVFPGHGVAAVAGLILMLGGLLMTFVGPEPAGLPGVMPHLGQTWMNLRNGVIVIICSLIGWLLLSVWLRRFLPKLPYFNRLILTTTSGGELRSGTDIAPENAWPGVGTEGKAVTDLRPGGSAEFVDLSVGDRRTVAVVSESGYVSAGSRLIVRESKGNRIVVRAARV
jgi:membrane-bound serine protease (ClpP class)